MSGARHALLDELQAACFLLHDELFGIDIMRIREIIRPQRVTRVVNTPEFMDGVINLRRAVIPVIDLRRRFGLPPTADDEGKKLIVVAAVPVVMGLLVDEVTEVVNVATPDIKPPPPLVDRAGADCLLGVFPRGDRLVTLLNIDRILDSRESAALAAAVEQAR